MKTGDCDFFVIGGGSGGVRAARMAAQLGASVVVAEAAAMGGTCVNVGCIPKKLYSYAAHFAQEFEDAAGFGWQAQPPSFDWNVLRANRGREISRLNGVYENLLANSGVEVVRGWAEPIGPNQVQVRTEAGDQVYTARHILIATGGTPSVPLFPGHEWVVSSDSMFDLEPFPRRLLVVGGGYIACEFASIFNGLGAKVTQLYRGQRVLRGFDDDIRKFIEQEMRKHGVDLHTSADVLSVDKTADGLRANLADGRTVMADTVLYATGRVPNVNGLGLEAVGVKLRDDGAILVDEHYQTSVPSIHAVGDVTARMQLTPVALGEAMTLVDRLFGPADRRINYDLIPTAVFTHPNIATVGLTEAQARQQFNALTIYRSEFKLLKNTLRGNQERTLMKLVVDQASDRVVGLHMVGADAGEVVQGFAVALKAGATKAIFDATIGIHPTAAEEFVTMREPAPEA